MASSELDSLSMVVGLVANPLKKSTRPKKSLVRADKGKLSAVEELAEQIRASLDPNFPSFVKLMVRSHVTGCFWLGLPAQFSANLPQEIVAFTLLDENEEEYTVKYLPWKCGLSGGWKRFAVAHMLVEGDALVFQLVKVNTFKVYIARAYGSAEVDGALGLLKLDAPKKGSDQLPVNVKKTTKKPARKHTRFCPSVVFHGNDQNIIPQLSGSDQHENQDKEVYIVRAYGSAEVDGALGVLKLDAPTKGSGPGKVMKTTEKPARKRVKVPSVICYGDDQNILTDSKLSGSDQLPVKVTKTTKKPARKRMKFCPSVVFHGNDQNISPQLSGSDQPENQSEEVIDSVVLEGIKFSRSVVEFEDIKNLESFNIAVNGLIIDSEVSQHVRTNYYELCRSQNSILHEHLVQGLNCKLVAGMISETVNIANAIKASTLSTSRVEFVIWENSLRAFKQLGMDVDFLISRLEKLVNMAFESEQAIDSRRYREAMIGRTHAEEEMRTLEMKLVELKDASKRFKKEIQSLKPKVNAEKFELIFRAEVNAPW